MRTRSTYFVLATVLLLAMTILGCASIAKLIGRPSPELVGVTAREEVGLDYKVHVDCTVLNNGASGDVTVSAELNMNGFWKKQQEVFVSEGESKKVTLTFSEPTFLNGGLQGGDYSCGL